MHNLALYFKIQVWKKKHFISANAVLKTCNP